MENEPPALTVLPFEHVVVAGSDLPDAYARIRRKMADRTPILLGDEKELGHLAENWKMRDECGWGDPAQIVSAARQIDVPALFQRRSTEEELESIAEGDWPDAEQAPTFDIDLHRQTVEKKSLLPWGRGQVEQIKEEIFIGLIPTNRSWEVAAHLCIGNWNACPTPMEHVAVAQFWNRAFGAETVAMAHNAVYFEVGRRPESREEALALARQHYAYCPETVDQGTKSLAWLAAGLMQSDCWSFSWD